jgi:hypothetical protein
VSTASLPGAISDGTSTGSITVIITGTTTEAARGSLSGAPRA